MEHDLSFSKSISEFERVYTLPGRPTPLARPRFAKSGYDLKVYDSQKAFKLQSYLNIKSQHHGLPLIDEPVHLDIIFHFKFPKSFAKYTREYLNDKPFRGRPDLDNLIKAVLDVCNKLIYTDDALVTSISARKVYGPESMTVFSFRKI